VDLVSWKAPVRNYDGIQFSELRKKVEGKYNAFHDALSAHYYNERNTKIEDRTKFIYDDLDYGILDKEKFDKLHGAIFELCHLALCAENDKAVSDIASKGTSIVEPVDTERLDPYVDDGKMVRRSDESTLNINLLKGDGLEIILK
jgi:hypothetical protein